MTDKTRPRKKSHAAIRAYPVCVYCGGPNEQVDHVPAKIIFDQKRRPKGLETPSCAACNQGMGVTEQVAAFVSRCFPSPAPYDNDLGDIITALSNNAPATFFEMRQHRAAERLEMAKLGLTEGGVLHVGPLLNQHILKFGAKMGMAMHFHNMGAPLPPEGGVGVRWFTNHQDLKGQIPPQIFDLVGHSSTLRNGRNSVERQFQYATGRASEGTYSTVLASFRSSILVLAVGALDREALLNLGFPPSNVFGPGSLKTPVREPLFVLRARRMRAQPRAWSWGRYEFVD